MHTRNRLDWAVVSLPFAPLAAAAYVLSEWLFFVTTPSSVSALPWAARIGVLVLTPVSVLPMLCVVQAIASVASMIGYPRARILAILPAAIVAGLLLMLLLDNFTRTVFGFGIVGSGDTLRLGYAALVPAMVVFVARRLARVCQALVPRRNAFVVSAVAFALILTGSISAARWRAKEPQPHDESAPPETRTGGRSSVGLPNIFLLGIDGVDANLLSAYGYERDTTPFLTRLRDETLFFENAFSNVSRTHGSLVSLLTGRLPFSTHVTFPPTILQDEDTHRGLPALLRPLGYTSLQIGMPRFADAEDAHLFGFDALNYRWGQIEDIRAGDAASDEIEAFRTLVAERLDQRIGHIFGLRFAVDRFAYVEGRRQSPELRDERRVQTLIRYFQAAREPWFVHLHLLDTHCCAYEPRGLHFSGTPRSPRDIRDSQIRETDDDVNRLFTSLKRDGRLERTIVVISSDHGAGWTTTERVPLMIRFPGTNVKGRVSANVQLADVAPTLLAYLGVEVPSWMDGVSLLDPRTLPSDRPIFSVSDATVSETAAATAAPTTARRTPISSGPPNFGVRSVVMIAGHRWYDLGLEDGVVHSGSVTGHTRPGLPSPSDEQARAALWRQLETAGFRVAAGR